MIVLVLALGVSYCTVLLFILYSSFYSLCSPLQLSSLSYILYGLISPFLLLRCALFSSLFHRLLSFLLTSPIFSLALNKEHTHYITHFPFNSPISHTHTHTHRQTLTYISSLLIIFIPTCLLFPISISLYYTSNPPSITIIP